jgi:hypothetical protein
VASDPFVEVGQWETVDGLLLVLANSGGAPTRTRVRLTGVGPFSAATQAGRGAVSVEQIGDDAILDVDVDVTAYIRLARRSS